MAESCSLARPATFAGGATLRAMAVPTLVVVGSLVLATILYTQYLEVARERWSVLAHDRNAHYLLGLSLAMDVRHLDALQLFSDLDGARTWPPLHGILGAIVFLVGGPDFRLSVIPSLAGWVGTIVLGFLTARRMVRKGSDLAGLAAVAFIVSSPAHRTYGTDTMLESLGACLTLLCLYLYLVAVQGTSRRQALSSEAPQRPFRAWVALGIALTALFLHKSNYWLLVMLALGVSELTREASPLWGEIQRAWREFDGRGWLKAQLRVPLNCVVIACGAPLAFYVLHGPLLSHRNALLSMRSPHNQLQLAYAALFLRVAWELWQRRQEWTPQLAPRYRQLLLWHGLPVAVWFLMPKKLGYWIYYVNPATNAGEVPQHGLVEALRFYWVALLQEYHLGAWSALIAVGLATLVLVGRRNLREGSRAVALLLLIALVLMVPHPNRKSRFLHSWVATGWVLAGAGLATIARSRQAAALGRFRPWLAASAAGGLALAHVPGLLAGPLPGKVDGPAYSSRDLTDYYLPFVAASRHATLLATMEMKHLARWSALERFGQRDKLEVDLRNYGTTPEENRRCFNQWLHETRSDTIVFVDVPPRSGFYALTENNEPYARLRDFLARQSVFRIRERRDFGRSGCSITIWQRADVAPVADGS